VKAESRGVSEAKKNVEVTVLFVFSEKEAATNVDVQVSCSRFSTNPKDVLVRLNDETSACLKLFSGESMHEQKK
jgi:hypothetical protein